MSTRAPIEKLASRVRWALAVAIGVAVFELLWNIWLAGGIVVSRPAIVDGVEHIESYLALGRLLRFRLLFALNVPVIAVTAVLWVHWQSAARRALGEMDAPQATSPPHSEVWWWFAPGANLVFPYRAMRHINSRSAALNKQGSSNGLLLSWWVTWWLAIAGGLVAAVRWMGVQPRTLERVPTWTMAALCWSNVFLVASGALAIVIVGGISASLAFALRMQRSGESAGRRRIQIP